MADKRITELQLIAAVTSGLSVPSDNGTQSYRFTAEQMKTFVLSAGSVGSTQLASDAVTTAKILDGNVTKAKLAQGAIARLGFRSISADDSATDDDDIIHVSASGGARTLTLPAVSGRAGKQYTIKKTDSANNAVIIDGNSTELIEGLANLELLNQNDAVTIYCDGSAWFIKEKRVQKEVAKFNAPGTWSQTGGAYVTVPFTQTSDSTKYPLSSNAFTIRKTSKYLITYQQDVSGANGESFRMAYTVNGGAEQSIDERIITSAAGGASISAVDRTIVTFNKGDVIRQRGIIASNTRTGRFGQFTLEELEY